MVFGFWPAFGPGEIAVIAFLQVLLITWPAWRICARAGFPGPLGLLAILPVFNFVLLLFLAFAEWPSLRDRKPKFGRDYGDF